MKTSIATVSISGDLKEKLHAIAKAGFDITPSNPAELADFVTVEIVKWAKVVKDSGAKAE